jgi:hypothetical protein
MELAWGDGGKWTGRSGREVDDNPKGSKVSMLLLGSGIMESEAADRQREISNAPCWDCAPSYDGSGSKDRLRETSVYVKSQYDG